MYILDDCYLIPQDDYTILGVTYKKDRDNLEVNIEYPGLGRDTLESIHSSRFDVRRLMKRKGIEPYF